MWGAAPVIARCERPKSDCSTRSRSSSGKTLYARNARDHPAKTEVLCLRVWTSRGWHSASGRT